MKDEKFMCTIYQGNFRSHKWYYLYNKCISTNKTLEIEFDIQVIIDIVDTRYKICKLNRRVWLIESSVNLHARELSNGKIE